MKIFINPGHSCNPGEDHGACYFGLRECDEAANIGSLVEKYLVAAGCEVKNFQSDSLAEIVNFANNWHADLFVSIHCNAAASPEAQGTETYCFYGSSPGRKLAACIHNQIVTSIPVADRRVKEAGFYVIKYTSCPAVLVETAFLSNENDASLIVKRADDFARAIARGVTDYFR